MLVNSELQNSGKNIIVAYVLWLFLGGLGAHRFYLGKNGSAWAQLLLTVLGVLTTVLLVGFVLLFFVGTWVFVDLFLVHKMVNDQQEELKEKKAYTLYSARQDEE